jgi:hypothetical protein
MTFGDFDLTSLLDGYIRLDGGAMFGVVPKTLWSKRMAADDRNRVRFAMRPLLIRPARGPLTIVDAGAGDKMDAKSQAIYGLERAEHLDVTMARAGVRAEDVELVIASHLHFDHAGGFTIRRGDSVVPRFPNARYVVNRGEWDDATHPHERNRASYFAENYVPLQAAGVVDFMDGDGEVLPSTAHVDVPWIMAYDLYPMETLEFKRAFVKEAIEREYLIFFEHDPHTAAGYLRERDGRVYVESVASER